MQQKADSRYSCTRVEKYLYISLAFQLKVIFEGHISIRNKTASPDWCYSVLHAHHQVFCKPLIFVSEHAVLSSTIDVFGMYIESTQTCQRTSVHHIKNILSKGTCYSIFDSALNCGHQFLLLWYGWNCLVRIIKLHFVKTFLASVFRLDIIAIKAFWWFSRKLFNGQSAFKFHHRLIAGFQLCPLVARLIKL